MSTFNQYLKKVLFVPTVFTVNILWLFVWKLTNSLLQSRCSLLASSRRRYPARRVRERRWRGSVWSYTWRSRRNARGRRRGYVFFSNLYKVPLGIFPIPNWYPKSSQMERKLHWFHFIGKWTNKMSSKTEHFRKKACKRMFGWVCAI